MAGKRVRTLVAADHAFSMPKSRCHTNVTRKWNRLFKPDLVVGGNTIYPVGEHNSYLKAAGVFTIALKQPKATISGELLCVTKERNTVIITVTLLGIMKRSLSRSSSFTEPCILGLGRTSQNKNGYL